MISNTLVHVVRLVQNVHKQLTISNILVYHTYSSTCLKFMVVLLCCLKQTWLGFTFNKLWVQCVMWMKWRLYKMKWRTIGHISPKWSKWSWTLQKNEDINMAHQNLRIFKWAKLGYHPNHLQERRCKYCLVIDSMLFSPTSKGSNWIGKSPWAFHHEKGSPPLFYQKGQVHGLKLWAPCESMELEGSHIIMLPLPFIVDNLSLNILIALLCILIG